MCPMIQPDFSEAADGVAPGTYSANIVKHEMKESRAGAKFIRWQLTVFNAAESKYNGQSVWTNTMLSGKGAIMLQRLHQAALGTKIEGSFDPDALLGKPVSITVTDGVDRETGEKTGFAEVKTVKALVAAA